MKSNSGLKLSPVHEATLKNGLSVRLCVNQGAPIVSLYTFFKVGSRNERPGITGISHLFEHMMFNGAKKYGPKEFDRILESRGGRSNAYTSHDATVYYEDFASDALQQVLDLESDRMGGLCIHEQMLESEREVVKEERRLRVENEILGILDEELATLVWKAHPYRCPVIGWMGDLDRITKHDCDQFFQTFYAPNNAKLYVVGDIHPQKTLSWIRRYYERITKGPALPQVHNFEPEQKGERRATVRHPAQAPSLMIGFRGPDAHGQDALALDVAQYLLSVGEGSRLVRELVYKKSLAVTVSMEWSWRIDPGVLVFYLELHPDSDPQRVERALYAQLERLASEGPKAQELEKARNNLWAHQLQELATNSGHAHALGAYELLLGDWRAGLSLAQRYRAVTAREVQRVAAQYFVPDQRSVVTLVPSPSGRGVGVRGS